MSWYKRFFNDIERTFTTKDIIEGLIEKYKKIHEEEFIVEYLDDSTFLKFFETQIKIFLLIPLLKKYIENIIDFNWFKTLIRLTAAFAVEDSEGKPLNHIIGIKSLSQFKMDPAKIKMNFSRIKVFAENYFPLRNSNINIALFDGKSWKRELIDQSKLADLKYLFKKDEKEYIEFYEEGKLQFQIAKVKDDIYGYIHYIRYFNLIEEELKKLKIPYVEKVNKYIRFLASYIRDSGATIAIGPRKILDKYIVSGEEISEGILNTNFLKKDGAVLIDVDTCKPYKYNAFFNVKIGKVCEKFGGARHKFACSLTKISSQIVSIVLSFSGKISIFYKGKRILWI